MKNRDRTVKLRLNIVAGLAVFLAFTTSGCDSALDVTDPDIVTVESLNSQAGISTLRAGSLGDLAVALSGSAAGHGATAGLIVMSGLMSDEFDYSGTFPTRREGDTRLVQNTNGTMDRIYGNLHRARAAAEATIDLATSFGGVPDVESEMESIVGYSYVIFAETFCAGVSFSKAPSGGGELVLGEPMTTNEMFNEAIVWFDRAAGSASGNQQLRDLASVGKGRALLGLGKISEADGAVQNVDDDFVYNVEHSLNSRRQENGIYIMSTVRRQYSIAEGKGGNGLLFRSSMDPRTPWDGGDAFGQDDITLYYNQLKYTSSGASVRLASGIEAQLIRAEAAAQSNNGGMVESILNTLRATIGLDPLSTDGMNSAQLRKLQFDERAFWLYSSGHRQGDLRRLVRVYGEDISSVFPWGTYFKGGEYASDVTFPVPQSEANNPNYVGCLDRNP